MERLTNRYSDGVAFIPENIKQRFGIQSVYDRLAEYEDLEITAEQVREIDKAHTELCVEYGKYTKLEQRLDNIFHGQLTLEKVVEEIECTLIEPDSPHPVNAKILTHAEAAEQALKEMEKEHGY